MKSTVRKKIKFEMIDIACFFLLYKFTIQQTARKQDSNHDELITIAISVIRETSPPNIQPKNQI